MRHLCGCGCGICAAAGAAFVRRGAAFVRDFLCLCCSEHKRCIITATNDHCITRLPFNITTMAVRLIGISGSLRGASVNTGVLRAMEKEVEVEMEIKPLNDVPLYNGDVEEEGIPPAVLDLASSIASADGLVLAIPEYNYGPSGVMKNALDWLSRVDPSQADGKPQSRSFSSPLVGTPVALVTAAASRVGGPRAQSSIRESGIYLGWSLFPSELYLSIFGSGPNFSPTGDLLDPTSLDVTSSFTSSFTQFCLQPPSHNASP